MSLRLALVAHDQKKAALAAWVRTNAAKIARHKVVATATTGRVIKEHCPQIAIDTVKSGPLGGDQQIGAMIAEGRIQGLFFFVDPLSPHPHDVDVKALMRVSLVYDIPVALNPATAAILIARWAEADPVAAPLEAR
jgi:methylglyoxal synthase